MKKKNRSNTKPIKLKFLLPTIGIILGVAIISIIFFSLRKVLSVKQIECQVLTQENCPPELFETLQPLYGQPLFFKDYQKILHESQAIKQPVTIVSIQKKLPNTIVVTFQPELAAYSIHFADTKTIVSKTGKTFLSYQDTTNLLIVDTPEKLTTEEGFIFPDVHHTLLTIIQTSEELQLPLVKVSWVDKSTIKLSMENREEQYIVDSDSPRLQLHKLAIVLKSSEYRDIAQPKLELDLRFNMPVLRTQP